MVAQVQQPAPAFKKTAVVNNEFKDISSEDLKGKWWVLMFVPLAHTQVCPTEVLGFNKAYQKFKEKNCEVLIASVDSEWSLQVWNEREVQIGGLGSVEVPLVSDVNHKLSKDYGVLLEEDGVSLRGTFLVGPEGNVRHMSVNDLPVGRSVQEVMRLLDAFQFTDENGVVCPLGWQQGAETINPQDPKEYFSKQK